MARFPSRRRREAVRRDYAIHGYLAKHGPCTAEEIAEKLHYGLDGVVMDLAVFKAVWKSADSGWEDDVNARASQRMPTRLFAPGIPKRRLYWLTADSAATVPEGFYTTLERLAKSDPAGADLVEQIVAMRRQSPPEEGGAPDG